MSKVKQFLARLTMAAAITLSILSPLTARAQAPEQEAQEDATQQLSALRQKVAEDPLTLAPIVWSVLATPIYPVRGTDGRIHLVYELHASNITGAAVRVRAIEVLDAKDNQVTGTNRIITVDGANVTGKIRKLGGQATLTAADYTERLGALDSGLVYMDVSYAEAREVPRRIKHRFIVSQGNGEDAVVTTVVGGLIDVSRTEAIVLAPPLKGAGWVNASGCCQIITAHRYTILPLNGSFKPPEHFAIDFIRFDAQGRSVIGDPKVLTNWHYYGAEIVSSTPGRVVEVVSNLPDQAPGQLPPNITIETAAGNHIIIDIGQGRYALYAHMIPGSAAVSVGDFVQPGQLLGRLGNSGNSDAPHLHFQIMDAPSTLNANGLPFVFDQMQYQGRINTTLSQAEQLIFTSQPPPIDTRGSGMRVGQMPLTLDIVGFRQ
ncbi:MAG: M23 family metallopeptidase [Blastocatellia bacterium]